MDMDNMKKIIGDAFEREKATEKLKAWKRLKDKGLRFNGVEVYEKGMLEIDGVLPALEEANKTERSKIVDDLWLLFGGEAE